MREDKLMKIMNICLSLLAILLFIMMAIMIYDFLVESPKEFEHKIICEDKGLDYSDLNDKCIMGYTCDEKPWQKKCGGIT